MELVIDDREKAISNLLQENSEIKYTVKRITIGDYALILNDNIEMIVERKTLKDLASSILDGRKDNIAKLIELRLQTNCKIAYIIEGNTPNYNRKINRIPYKNLLAHLDHLMMRDNVFILYTKSPEDTLERLTYLLKNISTIKKGGDNAKNITDTEKNITDTEKNITDTEKNIIDNEISISNTNIPNTNIQNTNTQNTNTQNTNDLLNQKIVITIPEIKFLSKIPGISLSMAEILYEKKITLNLIYNNISILEDIKYPSGRKFNYSKIKIKKLPAKTIKSILKEIPTIGEFKANLLVDEFYDLLENKHDVSSLDLLGISENSAKIILKYFV
jgi:ERCC4-type nuclease